MASPYKLFKTDPANELKGTRVDYGDEAYFVVARAGGANKKYLDAMGARLKPFRRQIATETMDEKVADRIVMEVFVDTVLLGWGSKEHGDGRIGDAEDQPLEFTRDNALKVLTDLPELFQALRAESERLANFNSAVKEEDAKN